ncbi:hypothetical protein H257_02816 [Aphanomyces astaci]|uniref:Uncharacterized protein n=1 Tax=Aphanomyces astaci TaxID=112090 RepID=W4H189_APHAT|nr:hypothetical protein H257_02816 [Aphanomyces astaci]ETV84918.1 hypothetical protein H257_02816 [Aphanomyces astaci]|eukprot:XP_009824936.1 hypothetical protein H257_02816 [Aphanomyces astaci]
MAFLNATRDGFEWHAEVSTPMHVSLGGELINALFVDDQTDGLNSLIVLTRVSATSVALLYVDVNEEEVIITRHHTHTLPLTWTDASVVAEIMDGPHVWLACPSQSESQLLTVQRNELHVLYLILPQPYAFQSAHLIANAAVDPTTTPSTSLDLHLLVHSTENEATTHHWDTVPLPRPPMSAPPRHLPSKRPSPPVPPSPPSPPKRYLPSHLAISCVYVDQAEPSSPSHRLLLGTTAPSLVELVHECVVATLLLPGTPLHIQHANVNLDAAIEHTPNNHSDVYVVTCSNHAVLLVTASHSTLSIVQHFSNVHGAILNDFACDGGDQVLLVTHKPEDERRWVLTDVMSTVVQASAANGGGITQHRSKKSRRKTAHADDNSIQVLVNKLAAPAQADKLNTIQTALALRANEAHATVAGHQAMLNVKMNVLSMLEHQCRLLWLAHNSRHTVPDHVIDHETPRLPTLLPLVHPLDSSIPQHKPQVPPLLVHPMVLESVVPGSVQHSPSNSTLHLVVTVRNASTTLLENVSVLLAGSNSELAATTTTTMGGSDVLALLGPHARHAFKCHVALAPGLHRRPHVDLHVLGTWGGQPDCLLFDGGRVRVDIADILTLPCVRAPHLASCELLLVTRSCQLDQWLPPRAAKLGLTIHAIKAGMAAVTVSAPNAGMLECQLRQVHSELTPHDIFALENPLHPTHIQLIQAVLSAMQTELAFESTTQPTPDGRASVQLALDRAMGDLHLAMKRRSDRLQRG